MRKTKYFDIDQIGRAAIYLLNEALVSGAAAGFLNSGVITLGTSTVKVSHEVPIQARVPKS